MTDASSPDDSNSEQPSNEDSSWERSNQELQGQLAQLIDEVCQFLPEARAQRRKGHNQIQRLIVKSGKLRRDRSVHYEGCLQQLWLYFFENLCKVNTEKYPRIKTPFCKELNIIARLILRLDGCIVDAYRKEQEEEKRRKPPKIIDGEVKDPVDQIPAPEPVPLPTASLPPFLLNLVRAAVEADVSGKLRGCHIENCPEANCQMLILQQLSPPVAWEALADRLGISISLLSSFYARQCKPLSEKISEEQLILYVRARIEADESGELRECHSKKYPAVTAQVLILRRLPPEVEWEDLSNEFKAPISTLNSFYERQCRPRLKAICEPLLNQWQPEEES